MEDKKSWRGCSEVPTALFCVGRWVAPHAVAYGVTYISSRSGTVAVQINESCGYIVCLAVAGHRRQRRQYPVIINESCGFRACGEGGRSGLFAGSL